VIHPIIDFIHHHIQYISLQWTTVQYSKEVLCTVLCIITYVICCDHQSFNTKLPLHNIAAAVVVIVVVVVAVVVIIILCNGIDHGSIKIKSR